MKCSLAAAYAKSTILARRGILGITAKSGITGATITEQTLIMMESGIPHI